MLLCNNRSINRGIWLAALAWALFFLATTMSIAANTSSHGRATDKNGNKLDADNVSGSLIGIQYENWFSGPGSWDTAEAVPILGKYTSGPAIYRKHFAEFQKLGIDWLLIDWSNMLWSKPAWEEHKGGTLKLEQTAAALFQTALAQHKAGKYAPKLVFMVGLRNGPPVPNGVERLNGMIAWLQTHYLDRPEYKDLWLYDGGKPLLVILYWPPHPCAQQKVDLAETPLVAPGWTVRWMSSQLQDNHAERCGMWSWMDGTIPQLLTRHDGKAEDLVVTPSSFQLPGTGTGWTGPSAIARDHGVPYLESWKAAFLYRPKFIQIHQWNEFSGQKNGQGIPADYWGEHEKPAPAAGASSGAPQGSDIYGDEYNLQLSDDLEPTRLDGCGYRGCGGWGYYYENLTRAIVSLYRGETPDITVLALSAKMPESGVVKQPTLHLHWAFLGKKPTEYSLFLDGTPVAKNLTGSEYTLHLSGVASGTHHIKLLAGGVHTYFDLTPSRQTVKSTDPLSVTSILAIQYSPPGTAQSTH